MIVDTNLSCDILKEISDHEHVAVMLSPQSLSVERFFDRGDEEKKFLLSEINKCPDPEKTLQSFKGCIARVNDREHYDRFANSGFFTIVRNDSDRDTREETLAALEKHFGLK